MSTPAIRIWVALTPWSVAVSGPQADAELLAAGLAVAAVGAPRPGAAPPARADVPVPCDAGAPPATAAPAGAGPAAGAGAPFVAADVAVAAAGPTALEASVGPAGTGDAAGPGPGDCPIDADRLPDEVGTNAQPVSPRTTARLVARTPFSAPELLRAQDRNCRY
jgi:hypothetical protein